MIRRGESGFSGSLPIRILLLICLTLPSLASCEDDPDRPEDLLEEEIYIELLTELFLTRFYVESADVQEQKESLHTMIFEHYSISQDRFERSHSWYQKQGRVQQARIDSVQNHLQEERKRLMDFREEMRKREEARNEELRNEERPGADPLPQER